MLIPVELMTVLMTAMFYFHLRSYPFLWLRLSRHWKETSRIHIIIWDPVSLNYSQETGFREFSVFWWRHQNSNKEIIDSSACLLSWGIGPAKQLYLYNFRLERVLRFAKEDAWISNLLRYAAFKWRQGRPSCRLKMWSIFSNFAFLLPKWILV